ERPFLHGAYKNVNETDKFEYVFFHRNEYLIFMNKDEIQFDYKYFISGNEIKLENSTGDKLSFIYKYSKIDSILILKNENIDLKFKSIDWRRSNALQPLFHLMIEDVK